MEERIYLNSLYDYYGELLTEKQKQYFEDYYFSNLTLAEIAENESVSRNAVHKQIKEAETKLKTYEEKLKIYEKNKQIIKILEGKIEEEIINEIKEIM